jgi:heme/copper-type cytochrome/quinol oxidase subunit 2
MNKDWQKNSWITATLFFVLGVTGILQAYIYSQEQPEAVFFVLTLVVSSIFFIISLPLLVGFVMSVRRARRLGGRVGDGAPVRSDSASSVLEGASEHDRPMKWLRKDMTLLVLAITGFVAGISRLLLYIDAITSNRVSGSITISLMIIAGLYLGCSVLFFAVYLHRKRKPRSTEAPPRLARSRGQPKEAREE